MIKKKKKKKKLNLFEGGESPATENGLFCKAACLVSSGSKNCCSCGRNLFTKFWEKGGVVGGKGGGLVVGHWLNYSTNGVVLVQAKKIEKKLI